MCIRDRIHRARISEQRLSIHQPILKDVHPAPGIIDVNTSWQSLKEGLQKLQRRDVLKPLIIMNLWFILVVFSGGACIIAFQVNILNDYPTATHALYTSWFGMDDIALIGYDLCIVSAVLTLIAVVLASILVNYWGIKNLFNISSVGMAIGLVGLAVSLSVDEEHQAMNLWRATHTASVWVIIFFYGLGVSLSLIHI